MEKNTASFSRRLNGPPSKRKLASESSSANVEDHELLEKNPSQLSCELDLKNPTFEELTLGMQKLQRQLTQVLSRMDGFEHRLRHIEARNEDVSRHIHNSKPYSHEIKPIDPNIDQLTKDFEERFDLVESNSQALIERVDSCQQNFSKITVKTESFENQLINLQQRLNNFEMHDTNMQCNEIVPTQQLAEEDTYQNSTTTVQNKLTDDMNTSEEQLRNDDDGCDLVEKALCTPCESQIRLSTEEVQYGLFDVCDKYDVILFKEADKLKLFDHQKQIDERPWGELGRNNFATCVHWCSFLNVFLILYRFRLYTLSLKRNQKTSAMEFNDLKQISCIRVYSLKHDTTNRTGGNATELLRFITTSPNLPGYLYLNRGYRRVELINTNAWRCQRGWSKHDLDYGARDEIRSINLSSEGTYLAMNIKWQDRLGFIDLRKHDDQLTLLKRIRMPKDATSLSYKVQIPFGQKKWLVIDENNQCYKVSADPDDQSIIPIRTDHIRAIENVQIRLSFVRNHSHLLVGEVRGDHKQKQGMFSFHKLPA